MKLILVITTGRKDVNFKKLLEATQNFKKKDTILVSGTNKRCIEARKTLALLNIDQSRILLDIKSKGTRHFVKEYINDYKEMTLVAESVLEIKLVKAMYEGKMNVALV